MKPRFILIANGRPITDIVNPMLESLTVTDETGFESDRLSIALDDTKGNLELPPSGAILSLQLGIGAVMINCGQFTVDTVSGGGGDSAAILRIEAHAVPMAGTIKMQTRKSRSWAGFSMGDIVRKIAGESGLQPVISDSLATVDPGHLDQTDESDTSFLARLARDCSAAVKIASGRLAFIGRGTSTTASGNLLPVITLARHQLSRWSWVIAERGSYKSVVAKYHDQHTAKTEDIAVGDGEPTLRLPHTYSTEANARRSAQARLKDSERASGGTIQLTMPARLDIIAESPITVTGIRQGVDGDYVARRVSNSISKGGLVTTVDCEKASS